MNDLWISGSVLLFAGILWATIKGYSWFTNDQLKKAKEYTNGKMAEVASRFSLVDQKIAHHKEINKDRIEQLSAKVEEIKEDTRIIRDEMKAQHRQVIELLSDALKDKQ